MPKPVGSSQRYMPGLDGLRAIAVLAVIAYHLDPGLAPGGLLGVSVFFTLSGYLITDLLLGQREALGRLRLGDFWLRRARRLLPALFLMLAVVVAWVTLLDRSLLPGLRGDVLAAVAYVSNWWNIVRDASYFARFGPPPPLDHLWSLAVEEQFYLIWPFLLWLGLRYVPGRFTLAGLTLAGAALSAAAMAWIYEPGVDPTRVYEGTDTRAFALLVGAALAMVWPSRKLRADLITVRGRLLLDTAGVVGLVVIGLLIWRTSEYSPLLYKGGILLLTVGTVLAVTALVHPASWLGVAVGWAPLRWLGVRSYGIYLWHYPIIVLTAPSMQQKASLGLEVIQVVATIAVAALSWRFFEEPIRRGAMDRIWARTRFKVRWWRAAAPASYLPRRPLLTGVVSVVAVAVLALDCAGLSGMVSPSAQSSGLAARSEKGPLDVGVSTHNTAAAPTTTLAPEKTSQKATSLEATSPNNQGRGRKSSEPESREAASSTMSSCNSVAYIGDSTSEGMVLPSYLPNPDHRLGAQYARVGATSQYFEISGARSIVETLSANQASGYTIARDLKANGFRGCWVIALGSNDTANVYVGSIVGLEARIRRMMRVMGGQPVLWITVKSLLDTGPYSQANMQDWNRTVVDACAKYSTLRVFDWASLVEDSWYILDGTHYTSEGYRHRARLSADGLAHAFPASGESSDCVVQ
ncbi:MAG: acyltransferase family protein [Actinomycetota bacterium]|nr:acyltransferase family protein [Actinomycetota bacterium]MDQ3498073.1 acyltransferase family protein [Actinomycetota bacterium]